MFYLLNKGTNTTSHIENLNLKKVSVTQVAWQPKLVTCYN
jgi:hypothetical protein